MDNEKTKSEIFYLDDKGNSTDEEHAARAIIRVTNEKGELIDEVFGYIEKSEPVFNEPDDGLSFEEKIKLIEELWKSPGEDNT